MKTLRKDLGPADVKIGTLRLFFVRWKDAIMTRLRKLALVSLGLVGFLLVGCDSEQLLDGIGTVQGTVLDEQDQPVANASITVDGTAYRALSNAAGAFVLTLPQGDWTLRIQRADGTETSDLVSVTGGSIVEGLSFRFGQTGSSTAGLRLRATVDGQSFEAGVPVPLTLTLRNEGEQARELAFASAQTHDFLVVDDDGLILWKWSQDRAFLQQTSRRSLAAGATWTFAHAWRWWETEGALEAMTNRELHLRVRLCADPAMSVVQAGSFRLSRPETAGDVAAEALVEGRGVGSLAGSVRALRSREELEAFVAALNGLDLAAPLPCPDVDFSTHMVVALCQGPSRNPEATIRVRSVEGDARRWIVHVADLDVWAGNADDEVGTSFQIARLPLCDEAPVFLVSNRP